MVFGLPIKLIVLFRCILYATPIFSQNLIKNPSFEYFENCPKFLGNFDADVIDWSIPTQGSTDYFNNCSVAMGTPKNFKGKQPADFGVGYAGMYLYAPEDYREYLQAELSANLVKGKKYSLSFYISLAELSNAAVKEFGILFSKDKMKIKTKKVLSKKLRYQLKSNDYNYIEIGYANFYSDTQDWILMNTVFEAKGTEQYMIIGNFKKNSRTPLFKTKRLSGKGAYYYIDMFLIKAVDTSRVLGIADDYQKPDANLELNKIYLFKNVLFEFDKFQLLEPAKKEIQRIYEYLNSNMSLKIIINGHTDAMGNDEYNKDLSKKRAITVADYFLKLGLAKSRISWQGYGCKIPVASNTTKKGRQENRRVEFMVVEP